MAGVKSNLRPTVGKSHLGAAPSATENSLTASRPWSTTTSGARADAKVLMLCRVSCKVCHISCLWTDDPKGFLDSVCLRYRHCQAKLIHEPVERPLLAKGRRTISGRVAPGKGVPGRGPSKSLHP
jgi:hypothetical protein